MVLLILSYITITNIAIFFLYMSLVVPLFLFQKNVHSLQIISWKISLMPLIAKSHLWQIWCAYKRSNDKINTTTCNDRKRKVPVIAFCRRNFLCMQVLFLVPFCYFWTVEVSQAKECPYFGFVIKLAVPGRVASSSHLHLGGFAFVQ